MADGEDAGGERPDAEEGRDAEVQQPGVPDDDVERQRQDAVNEDGRERVADLLAGDRLDLVVQPRNQRVGDDQGQSEAGDDFAGGNVHTFSRVRAPSRPVGRKTRMTIRMTKTIAVAQRASM